MTWSKLIRLWIRKLLHGSSRLIFLVYYQDILGWHSIFMGKFLWVVLQSGKVYIQRCNSTNSSSEQKINPTPQMSPKAQYDLIQPSSNLKPTLDLLEDSSLDLKLVSNCSPSSYTSVCTLDKVKSALDRAERTSASSSSSSRKRWMIPSVRSPTSSGSNSSSISVKEGMDHEDGESRSGDRDNGGLVATACPGCLLYVLISKSDPKCPKCNSFVQMPSATKKPKIDLNISMWSRESRI